MAQEGRLGLYDRALRRAGHLHGERGARADVILSLEVLESIQNTCRCSRLTGTSFSSMQVIEPMSVLSAMEVLVSSMGE